MMRVMAVLSRLSLSCMIALSLAACGRPDEDPAAGGLTVGESERLEAAAERLDQRDPSPARDDSVAFERDIRNRLEAENALNSER
jgi:hypothetical protein